MSRLRNLFHEVVALIRDTPVTADLLVSNEDKLRMYGLYKQATTGSCPDETVPPPLWQPIDRAKYETWRSYRNIGSSEAMLKYVQVAARQNHWLGRACRDLLNQYENERGSADMCDDKVTAVGVALDKQVVLDPDTIDHLPREHCIEKDQERQKRRPLLMERLFGLRPLLPRGKLDITPGDLAKAALFSLESSSSPRRDSCEAEICRIWKDQSREQGREIEEYGVVVGLSARSLLDLYLRAKNFPAGSEVIVTPPINIPSMISILKYHNLSVVAVDLPDSFASDLIVRIDVDKVQRSVTAKTVVIMVVHPFGIESASESDLKHVRAIADQYGVDLIEDCAECYAGSNSTIRPHSNLALYSFGTIKAATALGGGVAVLSDPKISTKMIRLHHALYDCQTQVEFLRKVAKAIVIQHVVGSPSLYAIVRLSCRCLGLDFDKFVSMSTRNFSSSREKGHRTLIRSIRRRPSLGLLKTLRMRLRSSKQIESIQKEKKERCEKIMGKLLEVPALKWPKPFAKHCWWLAPIMVQSPDKTSQRLLQLGYDVPRGLSQLQCIGHSPHAKGLMESVVYLPIASRSMSDSEISSLVDALSVALDPSIIIDQTVDTPSSPWYKLFVGHYAVVLILLIGYKTPTLLFYFQTILWLAVASIMLAVVLSSVLTFCMAEVYMQASTCFAKYHPMLRQIFAIDPAPQPQQVTLDDISAIRLLKVAAVHTNKYGIILTGATGFLGSSILYQLLKNQDAIESIDRIVIICRPKRGKSASERVHQILNQDFFSFLPKNKRDEMFLVMEGDTSKADAGLSESDLAYLSANVRIRSLINCAASVKFTQSLDEAAAQNITSAIHLHRLSQRLNAKLVHISTAFVHGGLTGSKSSPLPESLFNLEKFDPEKIYQSMTGNQMYASLAMSNLGFHNAYTFSKCITEHLLFQAMNEDVIIIRPAIIGPALCEPFEGWAGQKPSTIVAATCLYMKFPFSAWSFGKHEASVIPVDVVARFVLVKALNCYQLESFPILTNRSSCSSPTDSEFEKVASVGEVESLSSDCEANTVVSRVQDGSNLVIFNAAWNCNSSEFSSFSWYDFATSVPHVGTVLGNCSRLTAYIGFAVSVNILPSLQLKTKQFALFYHLLVQVPFALLLRLLEMLSFKTIHRKLSTLSSVLDLPVLFYPFANDCFAFDSQLEAPKHLDGQRYMFSCISAAHRFLYEHQIGLQESTKVHHRDTSSILIGGKDHFLAVPDFLWALTQPRGSILIRVLGLMFVKILRSSCTSVTVDGESFAALAQMTSMHDDKVVHVVLAPTHRSFYDFILISFLAFSLPELNITIPHIAAAYEFSNLPFLGWIIEHLNAFFVKRGCGKDPDLASQLYRIKSSSTGSGACVEVFIEGSRSRDRRFLRPKSGFLRCLAQTGGEHLFVPICINYERIPEQDALAKEGTDGIKQAITARGLLPWLLDTLMGKLPLGRIHIAAASPILVNGSSDLHFESLLSEIQVKQQSLIRVSNYHVKGAELVLGLSKDVIIEALRRLGCEFWPENMPSSNNFFPVSLSESWSLTMQFGHLISPMLNECHVFWAEWICPSKLPVNRDALQSEEVANLVRSFGDLFDRAEEAVSQAIEGLKDHGICRLTREHVVHMARRSQVNVPDALLIAFSAKLIGDNIVPAQIVAGPCHDLHVGNEEEELGMWGFKDSRFRVCSDSRGRPSVVMTGSRYAISGKFLKQLVPFIEQETKTVIDIFDVPVGITGLDVNECDLSADEIESIRKIVSRISVADGTRARHGTGHSHAEAYQLRRRGHLRVPDIVVWPSSEGQIESLIKKAKECAWNLIPHGGGTNVSQATRCPTKSQDPRPIVSVDMTGLKRILYLNEEDGLAHVEAGITGRELIDQMRKRGYTIGHEPDSLEFSTLGGWIATKASGMKRSKYGNIESVVVDIRVAGSAGLFWQGKSSDNTTNTFGRQSRGPDLMSLFLGSEGCLGIITSAVIRMWPLPVVQRYESIIFSDFDVGLEFAQYVSKLGPFMPASVRLLDNAHFRLGQALREEESSSEAVGKYLLKFLSPSIRSMSRDKMVCATILFEGSEVETREQHRQVAMLVNRYGGIFAGSSVGRSGYELTFVIAYLRDFALSFNFLGDSFETFAPWSKLKDVITSTKERIKAEHAKRCLPGEIFVGCRVTQLYHEGACLYFYMCMYCGNIHDASSIFDEIENAARQEILDRGGTLSHHHGVGKTRAHFSKVMDSNALRDGLLALKNGVDPSNIFGAGNGVFGSL